MRLKRLIGLVLSVAFAAATSPVAHVTAQAIPPVVPGARQALPADSQLVISGTVVRSDRKTIVANARIRLRFLATNAVVGRSVSGSDGSFSFTVSQPGLYVVEVVDDHDGVIAVSSALDAGASSPLITAVVLPATRAALLFSSTGLAVLAAAGGAGILIAAIDEGPQNVVSPEQ
jgi:hypothetical protein